LARYNGPRTRTAAIPPEKKTTSKSALTTRKSRPSPSTAPADRQETPCFPDSVFWKNSRRPRTAAFPSPAA
jgi:hypothetical protein